jgi:hypothetical protein
LEQGFIDTLIEFTVPVHRTAVILEAKRVVCNVAAYLLLYNICEVTLF